MRPDDKQMPKPNVDKKRLQELIKRQPEQTQKPLRKALKEHGYLDGKDDGET